MVRLLVIANNNDNNTLVCLDREIHKVYHINICGDEKLRTGIFICFESSFLANYDGSVTLNANDYCLEHPGSEDSIKLIDSNRCEITSWIGFSSNPDHITYERKVGYTDWYGLVDCSGFEIKSPGVYTVIVELNDITFNGKKCLMRLCSQPKWRKQGPKIEDFSRKMLMFEEERAEAESQRRSLNEMEMEAQVSGIVIFFEESTNRAICFSKPLESLITVQLPLEMEARPGQRIVFGDHDYSGSEEVFIPVSKPDQIKFENEETVRFDGNQMRLKTVAGFSIESNEEKNIAYAETYGRVFVDSSIASTMERGYAYQCELAINNDDINDKSTPLFRIVKVYHDQPPALMATRRTNGSPQEANEPANVSSSSANEYAEVHDNGNGNQDRSTERFTYAYEKTSNDNRLSDGHQTPIPNSQPVKSNLISPSRVSQSSLSSGDHSEPRAGPSDPPRPLRFGKQPHNVESTSKTANDRSFTPNEKEVENCVLVLDNKGSEIIGYETTLLKIMRLDVRNIHIPNVSIFGEIRFTSEGLQNGRAILKERKFEYSRPSQAVVWNNGEPTIPAHVVFSANRNHKTFNKSCGFSNYYGFVDIEERSDRLKHSTIYKTTITLKQCQNSLQPVFIAVSPLIEDHIEFSDEFARSLCDFEQRHAEEVQKNGLAPSQLPRFFEPPRQKFNKKPVRKAIPSWQTGLLVSVDKMGRYCGKLWTQHGDAYFKERPSHDSNGKYVSLHSWISVKIEIKEGQGIIVNKVAEEEIDPKETKVVVEGGETMVLAIIKSSDRLESQDHNIRYYRHPLLGIISTETELDFDRENCAHVICRRRSEIRLRTPKEESCFWYATPNDSSKNLPVENKQSQSTYNQYNCSRSHESEKGSSRNPTGYQSQDPFYPSERTMNASQNIPQYEPTKNQQFRGYEQGSNGNGTIGFQSSSGLRYPPNPSFSSSQYQNSNQQAYDRNPELSYNPSQHGMNFSPNGRMQNSSLRGNAIVVSRRGELMILYLLTERRAAFIHRKRFDRIRLGFQVDCVYIPVEMCDENYNAPYEVIEIIKNIDGTYETFVEENDSFAYFVVDLNRHMEGFGDYTQRTGNFVLSCDAVGSVLLDKYARDVCGNAGSAARIVEQYRGKKDSSEMMAICSYSECMVPKNMVEDCNDTSDIIAYVWKINRIDSTKQYYVWNQDDIKRTNLGPDFKRIEQEDDIDRQKKQAMQQFENSNRRSGFGSSASSNSCFMGGPSNIQHNGYNPNHEQFATPHGSVHSYGDRSARSFHTAHGSQNGYQTPVGSAMPPDSYHPMQSSSSNLNTQSETMHSRDLDNMLQTFRSMQDAVSVFISDQGVRDHMGMVSIHDLNQLDHSLAKLAEIEAKRRHGQPRY